MVTRAVNNHADDLELVSGQTPWSAATLPLSMEMADDQRLGLRKGSEGPSAGEASRSAGYQALWRTSRRGRGASQRQSTGCSAGLGPRRWARRRLRLVRPRTCTPRGSALLHT